MSTTPASTHVPDHSDATAGWLFTATDPVSIWVAYIADQREADAALRAAGASGNFGEPSPLTIDQMAPYDVAQGAVGRVDPGAGPA
jgi:hypothetical protein